MIQHVSFDGRTLLITYHPHTSEVERRFLHLLHNILRMMVRMHGLPYQIRVEAEAIILDEEDLGAILAVEEVEQDMRESQADENTVDTRSSRDQRERDMNWD